LLLYRNGGSLICWLCFSSVKLPENSLYCLVDIGVLLDF
jgi:hypothetical protein